MKLSGAARYWPKSAGTLVQKWYFVVVQKVSTKKRKQKCGRIRTYRIFSVRVIVTS